MAPWIFFLFVGVFDFGFYAYAAITTQNAARVAALQTAANATTASDSDLACKYVLYEMRMMPNVQTLLPPCPSSPSGITNSFPVAVSAALVNGPDTAQATQVTVSYQTVQLVPIPGLLMGRMTLTRIVTMRLLGN